jgi:sensor histidine kinase YesM
LIYQPKTLNWKYIPFVLFFLFTFVVSTVRYLLAPALGLTIHAVWFAVQYGLLITFWYTIRGVARILDKRFSYSKGFSRRVLLQISLSLIILVPPVLIVFAYIHPYLPSFFTKEFMALIYILLFAIIILMNAVLAAGIFFSSWQKTLVDRVRVEEERRNTEMELLQIKQKQAEIEMKALRAQMNPHFIFNSLNSINKYILKSDHITASRYLTRFAKLIRLILENSDSKEVALSDELEALNLYIEVESMRFANKFTYAIVVDENVSSDTLQVPPLIIQPYVENAIWHGLLHKASDGRLLILVKKTNENMLQCIIEDNGVGRSRAMELKSKSANSNKSMGMKLTEERLNMLNQNTSLNASIEIIDLYDVHGQGAGTKVIVTIPI